MVKNDAERRRRHNLRVQSFFFPPLIILCFHPSQPAELFSVDKDNRTEIIWQLLFETARFLCALIRKHFNTTGKEESRRQKQSIIRRTMINSRGAGESKKQDEGNEELRDETQNIKRNEINWETNRDLCSLFFSHPHRGSKVAFLLAKSVKKNIRAEGERVKRGKVEWLIVAGKVFQLDVKMTIRGAVFPFSFRLWYQ